MLSSLASVKSPSCNEPSASSATRYGCITTWLLSSNFRSSGFRSRKKSIQMLASAKQIQSCYTQRERRLDWIFPQEKSFLAKVGTGTLSLDLLLNHRSSTLNLRPSARSGIVPSSAARLREASRSISAFNASRSSAVRSESPLYSRARRIKSSSSDTVALIFPPGSNPIAAAVILLVPFPIPPTSMSSGPTPTFRTAPKSLRFCSRHVAYNYHPIRHNRVSQSIHTGNLSNSQPRHPLGQRLPAF